MSIVALKRKVNAKKNISNRQILNVAVPTTQPGPNAKRGLVARTNSSVINRNNRVEARSLQPHLQNTTTIKTVTENPAHQSVFSINGKRRIKGAVEDTNLAYNGKDEGCCSDGHDTIKPSVLSTKGMIQSRKYRNNNCCNKSCTDKQGEKKSLKNIENMTQSSSNVILNNKHKNELCQLDVICSSEDIPSEYNCFGNCEKAVTRINNSVNGYKIGLGVASSHSDYILNKKLYNERLISQTDKNFSC